jgi:hypothetical protein
MSPSAPPAIADQIGDAPAMTAEAVAAAMAMHAAMAAATMKTAGYPMATTGLSNGLSNMTGRTMTSPPPPPLSTLPPPPPLPSSSPPPPPLPPPPLLLPLPPPPRPPPVPTPRLPPVPTPRLPRWPTAHYDIPRLDEAQLSESASTAASLTQPGAYNREPDASDAAEIETALEIKLTDSIFQPVVGLLLLGLGCGVFAIRIMWLAAEALCACLCCTQRDDRTAKFQSVRQLPRRRPRGAQRLRTVEPISNEDHGVEDVSDEDDYGGDSWSHPHIMRSRIPRYI